VHALVCEKGSPKLVAAKELVRAIGYDQPRQSVGFRGGGHIQPKTSVSVDALLQIIDFVEGQSSVLALSCRLQIGFLQ
jgi:hypothetical protein